MKNYKNMMMNIIKKCKEQIFKSDYILYIIYNILYIIYYILYIIYLKADASAAGPKRFPNHSIQWIGSVMFFKWFCGLFVCYMGCLFVIYVHLALQYYLLKPSLRGRFVIYLFYV